MRRSSVWIAALLLALLCAPGGADARCQAGLASAPYIGAGDMRRITKAAAHLPRAKQRMQASIGAPVPPSVARNPVPRAVKKILPQYAYPGYSAFRLGGDLAIANGQGTLSYLLPLSGTGSPANCP